MARRTGAVVVSVGYRLAPEHPYPAAVEDAWHVLQDVVAEPDKYTVDPTRIAVMGDSAGGNMSAVLSLLARDNAGIRLSHQVLVCPVLDTAMDTDSYDRYARGHALEATEMAWFLRLYAGSADRLDPQIAPLRIPDKQGLAPATIVTAECDPLCDEGALYAQQLKVSGVPVRYECAIGAVHGFFCLPVLFSQAETYRQVVAERLRDAFAVATNPVK